MKNTIRKSDLLKVLSVLSTERAEILAEIEHEDDDFFNLKQQCIGALQVYRVLANLLSDDVQLKKVLEKWGKF